MQIRNLFVLVAFLSASLLMGSSLMAQQNLDTTQVQDTSSMISSIDSVYADSVKRASDSLSMLAKKKVVIDTTSYQKLMTHPYLPMQTKPSFRINELRILMVVSIYLLGCFFIWLLSKSRFQSIFPIYFNLFSKAR